VLFGCYRGEEIGKFCEPIDAFLAEQIERPTARSRNAPQQAPVSTCRGFATRVNVASRSTAGRSGSAAQAILKDTARVEEEEQRRL
jgi:hypothetical protein